MVRPVFSVSRAEVADGTHVRIYFTSSVENTPSNCSPDNFIFGGSFSLLAHSAVAFGDYIEVEVNQMRADTPQTVTVSNVHDVSGQPLCSPKTASFVGQGGSPQISYITAIDSRTVRVVFDEQMKNCAALLNPANYTFSGYYSLRALSVTYINPRVVDIATTPMVARSEYKIYIVNVLDVLNNIILPYLGKRWFTSSDRPKLLEAVALDDPLRVRLSFDRTIMPTIAFLDWDNFSFTGPEALVVTGAEMNGVYAVELYYANAVQDGQYTVTVGTAVDELGRDIDPYYNTTGFTGISGTALLDLVLASHPSHRSVLLRFNQAVEPNANLFNISNYVVTGGASPTVVQYIIQRDPEVIYAIVNAIDAHTLYTATVYNLVSAFGFPLGIHSASFTSGLIRVLSASALSATKVDVVFDTTLSNGAQTTNPSNYTIAYAGSGMPLTYTVTVNDETELEIDYNKNMQLVATLCTPAKYSVTRVSGTTPLTYTISAAILIDVYFNKGMDIDIILIDPTKYSISRVTGTIPLGYSIPAVDPTYIDVAFTKQMYIDTVLINPTKYSISRATGTVPLSYSVVAVDSTHVEVTFTKQMYIDTVLIDPTKYAIT